MNSNIMPSYKMTDDDVFGLKVGDTIFDYLNREVQVIDKNMFNVKIMAELGHKTFSTKVYTNEELRREFTLFKSEKSTPCEDQ